MLVDFEIILCVHMLSGIATISHNNLGMRQSLSLLTELLLLSFLDTNIQKNRENWNLHKIYLAIVGWVAVKKAWFIRLIRIIHCDICSRQRYGESFAHNNVKSKRKSLITLMNTKQNYRQKKTAEISFILRNNYHWCIIFKISSK